MKKLILILSLFLAISSITLGQTSPNIHPVTYTKDSISLTANATLTEYMYKGLKVWKTDNVEKYFVIRKSKESGNYYKYPLRVE